MCASPEYDSGKHVAFVHKQSRRSIPAEVKISVRFVASLLTLPHTREYIVLCCRMRSKLHSTWLSMTRSLECIRPTSARRASHSARRDTTSSRRRWFSKVSETTSDRSMVTFDLARMFFCKSLKYRDSPYTACTKYLLYCLRIGFGVSLSAGFRVQSLRV